MLYTSLEGTIGKILRGTRLQDTSYIADMNDWIVEVLSVLQTKRQLVVLSDVLTLDFHKARLPSGLVWIDRIEYNGCRVMPKDPYAHFHRRSAFISHIDTVTSPLGNDTFISMIDNVDLEDGSLDGWGSGQYYLIEGNYISFSCESGDLRINYQSVPVDCNGYPLIPDIEDLKQAIYFYVRRMMVETGYKDPVFTWQILNQMYELHCARALGKLLIKSEDEMDMVVDNVQGNYSCYDLVLPTIYSPALGKTTTMTPFVQEVWVVNEPLTGAVDGTNTTFTSLYPYKSASISVFVNGVQQDKGVHYNPTSRNTIQFNDAPLNGESVRINYIKA